MYPGKQSTAETGREEKHSLCADLVRLTFLSHPPRLALWQRFVGVQEYPSPSYPALQTHLQFKGKNKTLFYFLLCWYSPATLIRTGSYEKDVRQMDEWSKIEKSRMPLLLSYIADPTKCNSEWYFQRKSREKYMNYAFIQMWINI